MMDYSDRKPSGQGLTPFQIAALYVLLGSLWILLSDYLLFLFIPAPVSFMSLQTLKGWLYVLFTTGLLYLLVSRSMAAVRRSVAALKENEARYSSLMSNLSGMVYRCRNDEAWTMIFVSAGCLELTGYQPADLVENRVTAYAQLIHPEDREHVRQQVQQALAAKQPFKYVYRLVTLPDPGLGRVKADPGQLEQVILNLAVNARDAMPYGGALRLETTNTTLAEAKAGLEPGRYVLLAVSDTGVGMDAETQAHLFEPFFTTKEAGKGTGLGLATAYGIVKQSGGAIMVTSEPGQGATFKIYLPVVDEPARPVPAEPAPAEPAGGSETILLVEDEAMVRNLSARVLSGAGYNVLKVSSGPEALRLCQEYPDRIDLLLTDVVMPGMSGGQLAEKLTALRPDLKVLYMSGYTDSDIVQHGVLRPGTLLLNKPFTPQALAHKVREALDRRAGPGGEAGGFVPDQPAVIS